jgi:hypothetical protein
MCIYPMFESLFTALYLFNSFGMAGSVQYTYINPVTGKQEGRSLLSGGAESVQFCSAISDSVSRTDMNHMIASSWLAIKAAETACESPAEVLLDTSQRRGDHSRGAVGSVIRLGHGRDSGFISSRGQHLSPMVSTPSRRRCFYPVLCSLRRLALI